MFGLRKKEETKKKKRNIKYGRIAEGLILALVVLTAVNKDYALVPVALIIVFALLQVRKIVIYVINQQTCKVCKVEMEIVKEEREIDGK